MNKAVVAYDFNPITQEAKADRVRGQRSLQSSFRTASAMQRDPVKGKERNEDNSMNRTGKRGQMVERLFSMYQARVHPQQGTS